MLASIFSRKRSDALYLDEQGNSNRPLFGLAIGILACLTLGPLLLALFEHDYGVAFTFLMSGLVFSFFTTVGLSIRPLKSFTDWLNLEGMTKHGEFLSIIAFIIAIPAIASLPLVVILPEIGLTGAYFEMVSAITTTGATLFVEENTYPRALILWRSLVSGYGGFAVIVLAAAILSPRGFDGRSILPPGYRADILLDSLENRLVLACSRYMKLYLGGLLVGFLCFLSAGNTSYNSILLSIVGISTCGFKPPSSDGVGHLTLNHASEVVLLFLMLYGAFLPIIMFWSTRHRMRKYSGLLHDPEIKLAISIIFITSAIVFIRHWFGAFELNEDASLLEFYEAGWGTIFTVTSFLTTTGIESTDWSTAQLWSGLSNPAMLLLFLSVIGGAASSNTGGIKLIRALHLFHHSSTELSKLAMPQRVSKTKWAPYSVNTLQASLQITWVFFMLFIVVFSFGLCMLTLMGLSVESAIIVTLSSLTNTGPAFNLFSVDGLEYRAFRAPVQSILCLLMILGRIETLVFIAFLNPHHWIKDK